MRTERQREREGHVRRVFELGSTKLATGREEICASALLCGCSLAGEMASAVTCYCRRATGIVLILFLLSVCAGGGILPCNASAGGVKAQIGINYGQIADNLPSPDRVAALVRSIGINKVKLYDADPRVLRAFSGSGVEFVVGIGNEYLANMTDPEKAMDWVKENVQPYLPETRVTSIAVGNEVYSGNDSLLMANLVPAMQNIHSALVGLGLEGSVNISTAHSQAVLGTSYPPSAGAFRPDLIAYIKPLLDFLSQTGAPFLINAYPYFAYKDKPDEVPLDYVLFQPNQGMVDSATNLHYDNMLYAQIDAVYAALSALGYPELQIQVSETGWPSKGDPDEAGATVENARIYNGNLLGLLAQNKGTPMKPSLKLQAYVFALFNENLKNGPTSERNYGLFKPDGSEAYNVGLGEGSLSGSSSTVISYSSSAKVLCFALQFLLVFRFIFWLFVFFAVDLGIEIIAGFFIPIRDWKEMHYYVFSLSIYLQVVVSSLCSFFLVLFLH